MFGLHYENHIYESDNFYFFFFFLAILATE